MSLIFISGVTTIFKNSADISCEHYHVLQFYSHLVLYNCYNTACLKSEIPGHMDTDSSILSLLAIESQSSSAFLFLLCPVSDKRAVCGQQAELI